MNIYRKLSNEEIKDLEDKGCRCKDWSLISVGDGFSTVNIRNTNFSGEIFMGRFDKEFVLPGNVTRQSGISNATIHNCRIGDNVCINQVRSYLANYIIEDDVLIDNVDIMSVENETSFGNGASLSVMCEMGGRNVKIFDHLSAQVAYVLAMYRDRNSTIDILNQLIDDYSASVTSSIGTIGKSSKIVSCKVIKNVKIGPFATIDNVFRLQNGTVNSCQDAPTYVGLGVIAEDFIVSRGSKISDSALLINCFVGEACVLGKQYSAENSLFFANCVGYHGEACSIFAGPFTVTHHKSTLLIAGQFSFMNAGSGSNQSNHLYKLGPVHQGILERGAKTASDSYIMWPAKIGPFTVVTGRHTSNADTSDLPFSYLLENNDESILIPGINLKSVGTIRDAQKWPQRDKRTKANSLDCINFNLLSPFTIHRMYKALEILDDLQNISGTASQWYAYRSTKIKNTSLNKGRNLYKIAIIKFLGNSLISRIENADIKSNEDLINVLKPDTEIGNGVWIDLAGLISPKSEIQRLLDEIETNNLSLEDINTKFKEIHNNYYVFEWTWALNRIEEYFDKHYSEITIKDVIKLVMEWKKAVVSLDNMIYEDAKKEFDTLSKTGFGADGEDDVCDLDFESVRGNFESNKFVKEVLCHIEKKTQLGDKIIDKLQKIH
ncbi:DUF4954 family protein [Odoribacter sp. OttesenSCG-928-L07]|nr:DUF4954 family protein [Odoribacter sp. OttesenSCG-928-L07]MDL2239571.1 DUF4954 family protein [Bacteroidales bacterium OttesenSCG-928-L14]MDL2241048.1 DUF4954 family protein [Bacteroidales bacterium OttesenSCG-928-K22]